MRSPATAPPLAGNVIASVADGFVIASGRMPGARRNHHAGLLPFIFIGTTTKPGMCLRERCACGWGATKLRRTRARLYWLRGTLHTYCNAGSGRLRYLLVMTSSTYRLIQEIHATKERSSATLRAVFAKYDSELLDG